MSAPAAAAPVTAEPCPECQSTGTARGREIRVGRVYGFLCQCGNCPARWLMGVPTRKTEVRVSRLHRGGPCQRPCAVEEIQPAPCQGTTGQNVLNSTFAEPSMPTG